MASDDSSASAHLPPTFGPLIGRAEETSEILSLLTTARLFTLTGVGGSGKSRLAAQVAAESREDFPDGVRWVDLGALTDPALIPHVIAARCGIVDRGGPALLDALATVLRPRRLLLVLDNCEHVLPECARVVEALLTACPDLHILATSREAFALPGEVTWLIAPLRIPDSDTVTAVEDLLTYEAVALFVARATEVLPRFRLTTENAASIARICHRLDGLPLALELAAARLRVLSPMELEARLDDALRLLTGGSRTAPPRQQTLRATLDWSYRLLTESERALFGRLAVFAGPFSLAAAEQVGAGPRVAERDVLDVLSHLVEKSLVTVHDRGEETHFRLLEPVRQYARERLAETREVEPAERRHRDWCVALAREASTGLSGPEQGRWLDRLDTDHDNLRAALGWSLERNDAARAGQIAAGIWQLWLLRGYLHEGRHWLEQILASLSEPAPLRAHLLWIAGILSRPDAAQAQRRFEESLDLWQSVDDRDGIARTLGSLGFMAQVQGDHRRAVSYLERSLPLARTSADAPALARILNGLALSVLETGNVHQAMSFCQEALDLCRQKGHYGGAAAATANLGLIWQARGDERRAAELFEESLAERRRIGDLGGVAHVLTLLGSLEVKQGAFAPAIARYQESLALRRRIGDDDGIPPALEGLAAIGAAQGGPVPAVQLAAFAASLRAATGVPLSPREGVGHDRTLASLRRRLDPPAFERAWSDGQTLSLAQVLAVAGTVDAPESTATVRPPPFARSQPETMPTPALTARELDVLRLLTFGLTYAQIAESLLISPRTVDAHVRAIFGKLDVHSRSAATRIALQHQLV